MVRHESKFALTAGNQSSFTRPLRHLRFVGPRCTTARIFGGFCILSESGEDFGEKGRRVIAV